MIDFETYSEAGYVLKNGKWKSISASPPHGLAAVGAAAYAEHPSTELLSAAYDIGRGVKLWTPDMLPPSDLFSYIKNGGILEAWNSQFEFYIWYHVCYSKLSWIFLDPRQLRDPSARARAFGLPGALIKATQILKVTEQKDKIGTRLIAKFSRPHVPSSKDPRLRIFPNEAPDEAKLFYEYNLQDVRAQSNVSKVLPDLSDIELQIWLIDQSINYRGVHIDTDTLQNFIDIIEVATDKYTKELFKITKGAVDSVSKIKKFREWLETQNVTLPSLSAAVVDLALSSMNLPAAAKRALQIRKSLSASSVKKLYSIKRRLTSDNRLHGLFAYCGAERTGRFAGRGSQPQNLPNHGLKISECECGKTYNAQIENCPWCGLSEIFSNKKNWGMAAVENCIEAAIYGFDAVETIYFDVIGAVSGCLRGLFCAAPGTDLICSDYSAIEAVVLSELAEESWRQEVFRTHSKIYEMSASKITGVDFDKITPELRKIGKVAELASGYQGGIGAWKKFGAEKYFKNGAEIRSAVSNWRAQSPAIVAFWHNIEKAAVCAIQNPGTIYSYHKIKYFTDNERKILHCELLSGRKLIYHVPRLQINDFGKPQIKYKSWSTIGGWCEKDTYGGKLTENIVQAVARDILCNAMINLERAGYSIVLHVHDEIVAEVLKGTGSIEHFESIMSVMPEWAHEWPIFAKNGWRGKRYRK